MGLGGSERRRRGSLGSLGWDMVGVGSRVVRSNLMGALSAGPVYGDAGPWVGEVSACVRVAL